jgi:hypothetical protein
VGPGWDHTQQDQQQHAEQNSSQTHCMPPCTIRVSSGHHMAEPG